MDLDNVYSGHLYAVKTRPCWFEPFIAVDTEEGLRLLPAAQANVEISSDGPFEISDELIDLAVSRGFQFKEEQICSLWSERFLTNILEEAFSRDSDQMLPDGTLNWEARTTKPSEDLSNWLRKSEDWPGSSSSVFYDSDGKFSGSFVTLFTGNPYQLAMLLTWLGVPREIIASVTGLDDVLPS
jgi:hypothetical protein